MQIIFGHVSLWSMPIILFLQKIGLKVFYFYIKSNSIYQKDKIANTLKKNNIIPLPIEFEKNISKSTYSLFGPDKDEISYKKNIKMMPDKILKKYCKFFSIEEIEVKKLRLIFQDIIGSQQLLISARMGMWLDCHPTVKIIFIDFKLNSYFVSDVNKNITKIIIPFDVFEYLIKFFKGFFLLFIDSIKTVVRKRNLDNYNLDIPKDKKVAFVVHKGLYYGYTKLFDKTLYYSENQNSYFNKYNILHLDYSSYPCPEKKLLWVNLKKKKLLNIKILYKTFITSIKTLYLIRNWSSFVGWFFLMQQFKEFISYSEILKNFKKLQIALIDYDCLCPKTLILAFKKNNVRTIATQERFVTTFYRSYQNVMVDTYFVTSSYTADFIKKSKYYDVKNVVPVGLYRSDYIPLFKNNDPTDEISNAKREGKKIVVILGFHSTEHWVESHSNPILNWTAQINFLEDCIKLSKNLENTYFIIRYKNLDWANNQYFEKVLNKIKKIKNLVISNNYNELYSSYKLCAHADLVLAKHTSLADECLVNDIPVLFHEYTHNMKKQVLGIPNYIPHDLICHNFEELYEKSKRALFEDTIKLKQEIKKLKETVYFVPEVKNIKKKIIENLEASIN